MIEICHRIVLQDQERKGKPALKAETTQGLFLTEQEYFDQLNILTGSNPAMSGDVAGYNPDFDEKPFLNAQERLAFLEYRRDGKDASFHREEERRPYFETMTDEQFEKFVNAQDTVPFPYKDPAVFQDDPEDRRVLDRNPLMSSSKCRTCFVDMSGGKKANKERKGVVRERDGTLRTVTKREQVYINAAYFGTYRVRLHDIRGWDPLLPDLPRYHSPQTRFQTFDTRKKYRTRRKKT